MSLNDDILSQRSANKDKRGKKLSEEEIRTAIFMKKLHYLRNLVAFSFIGFGINYIEMWFFRTKDKVAAEI